MFIWNLHNIFHNIGVDEKYQTGFYSKSTKTAAHILHSNRNWVIHSLFANTSILSLHLQVSYWIKTTYKLVVIKGLLYRGERYTEVP